MTVRKAFSFLRSFYEAACTITDKKEQADFYNAIFRYAFDGVESDITGTPLAMFTLAKPNIDFSLKKSEAGALGGSTRQGRNRNSESKPQANDKQSESKPQANDKQSESKPQANDKQSESKPQAIKDKGSRINDKGEVIKDKGQNKNLGHFDAEFETFWQEYPKKIGKGAAKKAFEKARLGGVTLESLVTAVRRQKCGSQWSKDDGQYIPHPATWLNQERWEDEVYSPGVNNNLGRGSGQSGTFSHGKNDYKAGMAQALEILRRDRERDNDG